MNREATIEGYDSPERVKRREQLARSIVIDDVPGGAVTPMRKPDFELIFRRLKKNALAEERKCAFCGSPTTDANNPPLCSRVRCASRLKARVWAALPKAEMLTHTLVPKLYAGDFDVRRLDGYWRGRWPTCGDPEVPKVVRGLGSWSVGAGPENWSGDPPFVTIIGPNQYGKTRMAVEMCARAIKADGGKSVAHCFERSGGDSTKIYPLFFVRAFQLLKEDRELRLGSPRAMMNHALAARFLVVDDLGWSPVGIEALANLCEERHSRRRPTVWTSHLHFSATGEGNSIWKLSEMIWARMRHGLVVALGDA